MVQLFKVEEGEWKFIIEVDSKSFVFKFIDQNNAELKWVMDKFPLQFFQKLERAYMFRESGLFFRATNNEVEGSFRSLSSNFIGMSLTLHTNTGSRNVVMKFTSHEAETLIKILIGYWTC